MDDNNDPYEQRLVAVFKSCLTKGQTELEESAWYSLCNKLHLDEYSDALKSCIQKSEKQSISYQEFRDGLLLLLGKQQRIHVDGELILKSQYDINTPDFENKESESLQSQNSDVGEIIEKMKTGLKIHDDKQRNMRDKLDTNLNTDSTDVFCISNCLGIPTLPKKMVERIFEKLDDNCDGLIDLNEFCIIFENHKTMPVSPSLEWSNEFRRDLPKQHPEENILYMLGPHHTGFVQKNSIVDLWKIAGIPDAASLLTDLGLVTSNVCLNDLMAILSNELKSFNELSDQASIQVHINLLRGALILYQEELRNLNALVKSLTAERDKLRLDIAEANERANSLAQEIDQHHSRQDEFRQDLLKKVEQRYTETIKDLTTQLNCEQEANATVIRAKEQQLQALQQENSQNKSKLLNVLKENHALETESENLREQYSRLQTTNVELLKQLKELEAEHDEANSLSEIERDEALQLMERIKKLQSEVVLLRDQNDELTIELETLKLRDNYVKNTRQESVSIDSSQRSLHVDEGQENVSNKLLQDQEPELKYSVGHTRSISCDSLTGESNTENVNIDSPTDFPTMIVKELKSVLLRNSECSSKNCAFKDDISIVIKKFETELQSKSNNKQCNSIKSLASELEIECQHKTGEQLRDFVSKPNKLKRALLSSAKDATKVVNIDDNFNNMDSKNTSQNKMTSLRDYPPRKEEHSPMDQQKSNLSNFNVRICNDDNGKCNVGCSADENSLQGNSVNNVLREEQAKHAAEREKLLERCKELERSLELLRTEYDECEDYWTLKLEEERQLFEQEQKISDEKFSELIAKIEEYEELLKPDDKPKNDGRLSPIEEKFNLEQQYLDLEDEFKKYKSQVVEDISQKEKEIEELCEKIKSVENITKTDISVQIPDETTLPVSKNIPYPFVTSSPITQSISDQSCDAQKMYETFYLNDMSGVSGSSNDLLPHAVRSEDLVDGYTFAQVPSADSMHRMHSRGNFSGASSNVVDQNYAVPLCKENSAHKVLNGPCIQAGTQDASQNVDVNMIQILNKKLKAQERKTRKLQELYKRRQQRLEQVLHRTWTQHNVQISELQFLLCTTQEKLQLQIQITEEQTKKLASADILVQNLYVENACLMTNVKRLEERCRLLS